MADEEKTEEARPKQIQEYREKGDIPKSREVSSALGLLVAFLALKFFGYGMFASIKELTQLVFTELNEPLFDVPTLQTRFADLVLRTGSIIAPVVIGVVVMGVLANYAQGGALFSFKIIAPDFEKINFIKGFSKLFSTQSLVDLAKTFLKIGAITYIAYITVVKAQADVHKLAGKDAIGIFSYVCGLIYKIGFRVVLFLIFFAVIDFLYQRWNWSKKHKISKYDWKKSVEEEDIGSEVKRAINASRAESYRKQMMREVPKADVVVTNPTSLAVALVYEIQVHFAPIVLAKGEGRVANQIKDIAREHNIPIIENKPLARALYEAAEIGGYVPEELYITVAEILGRIWQGDLRA